MNGSEGKCKSKKFNECRVEGYVTWSEEFCEWDRIVETFENGSEEF